MLKRQYYINEEYIGHILCRNCLLKHVTEGKIEGRIEVTGRRGRRRTTVIKKIRWMLKYKNCYSKRHIAINPPQNTAPHFKHTYPIVLATFWSGSGSPFSWVSLVALSWLPRFPESIQNVYLSWSFWLWGRARSSTVPDPVNKVDEDTP